MQNIVIWTDKDNLNMFLFTRLPNTRAELGLCKL